MITSEQKNFLFQVNSYFSQIENLFSSQFLDQFHTSWFETYNRRDQFVHDQHQRSLEREKQFRSEVQYQRF